MRELFQECRRGNILIGTLRLDKDVRFKSSKVIIKYTTGRCCWKIYIYCFTPPHPKHTHTHTVSHFSFPLYLSLSCQRWKENLISIRLNCGGQHYQFKRPGDLTAPTPWWLITSQLRWAILSPLSFALASGGSGGGGGGWGQRTISAALITGLTGKGAQVTSGYSRPITPSASQRARNPCKIRAFVYSSVCDRNEQHGKTGMGCESESRLLSFYPHIPHSLPPGL